ncbi:MAG: sigma-70 family RNA polymerase sigma factor [Verrucomicrobia bacterium]|nr:sigma-70 family RNA polymerase sigma factor [Verrucomicrobiota bacterium]
MACHGSGVSGDASRTSPAFATTRWTLVLAAGDEASSDGREALEQLCRGYWFPLYAYIRRRGHDPHTAQDLTQGFFARLLERNDLGRITREGGRFRSFLLTALNHFLVNEHERATAQKRGRGHPVVSLDDDQAEDRYRREPSHAESPDRLFERQWAMALMEEAMNRLTAEQAGGATYPALRPFLSREPVAGEYAALAARLGLAPGTLAVQVHRLRERYRQLVRSAVADTVESPLEVDAEMRHLLAALGAA